MTHSFDYPFPQTAPAEPCGSGCAEGPCLVCGYDTCGSSGCADLFTQTKFLNGYIAGFNSKIGFGGSESSVSIDLVFPKNECGTPNPSPNPDPSGSPSPACSPCPPGDDYEGYIGYIYSFCMGKFSFRGILTNHTYSIDSGGYKYRVTLTDGRSIMGNIVVILNTIYDRPPQKLEYNLLNALYFLEPSVDDCDGANKCNDFMKSGANKKGIFLKRAFEKLDGKQIQVPVSKICLTLDFAKLIKIIPDSYRTSSAESSLLDLVSLACDETGYDFFCKISNDNKLEVIPVNYKKAVVGTPLLSFIDNLNKQDIVISKEYGEEMSFEKNKRIIFGDFYHYLTTVEQPELTVSTSCEPTQPNPTGCKIINPPFSKLVTRSTDSPLEAFESPEPSCSPQCSP